MEKTIKIILAAAGISMLSACGSGSSSSDNDARYCVDGVRISNGAEYTNNCSFKVNVAVFDPIFRFSLEAGETQFLARTENLEFGACKASSKPKDDGNKFFCD